MTNVPRTLCDIDQAPEFGAKVGVAGAMVGPGPNDGAGVAAAEAQPPGKCATGGTMA